MHKGYAFVQFTNPFDARNACLGEDGRTVLGQVLGNFQFKLKMLLFHFFSSFKFSITHSHRIDVNIVAEPKEHQIGRKRQNNTKTGNDWDYYYDR